MKYNNVREEEIKNRIATDFFPKFDCDKIIGFIDFAVKVKRPAGSLDFADEYLLWAEAKTGSHDIYAMFAQLVLTIGKARTFDKMMPPPFLGCFDGEKMAFLPYSEIQNIFYQNDFNWKITPSNTETKEFQQVYNQLKDVIDSDTMIFDFERDEKDLHRFIKQNFVAGKTETTKVKTDKNNFIIIYNKWLQTVKPTIAVNWDLAKKKGIIDGDFYLADLLALENKTIKDKLSVILKQNQYELDKHKNEVGLFTSSRVEFTDNQKAHHLFWNKYERPPREEYWDYIVKRRDLLVPQDVRERKGSFFTPQIWVELSQKYIADVLGEDWQDEYYVWDCAAGTGNLLAGLTNKYNIWASTLDRQDVDVMRDRIKNGANLLDDHVFQFDFLNDDFSKLPQPLQNIINDEQKRRKLILYINPPYAEASSTTAVMGTGNVKSGVATEQKTKSRYQSLIGAATNEVSAQFMARIYHEIAGCQLGIFSKLKFVCTPHFITFRKFFKANYQAGFVVHADTFDNVSGKFPIAFTVWDLNGERFPDHIEVDVPEEGGKKIFWDDFFKSINDWIKQYQTKSNNALGFMVYTGNDFNRLHLPYIMSRAARGHLSNFSIADKNLMETTVYFAVRLCIEPTWLNDRDQFLYPNDGWRNDTEFQNDCLTFALFHGQNRISAKDGVNHWIPFTEQEVNAREKFDSNFMTNFMTGKIKQENNGNLFVKMKTNAIKREFSPEAQAVFAAGKSLWRYYHSQPNCNVNASLYDIREHFQGRNDKGKMNSKSVDEQYSSLLSDLRKQLKTLAKKIEPKVYEYGFLK